MLSITFLLGLAVFAVSSAYFWYTGRNKNGLNSAFLVSFVTLVSYVLMWQGKLVILAPGGQPIYWTRWLFYAVSCSLLMVEIAQLRGIKGGDLVQLIYLTVLVMFTGFLAARDVTILRWAHFIISTVAYVLLVRQVLAATTTNSQWVNRYLYLGWSAFPVVFLLAPAGLGLLGAGIENLLYLVLDIYTKILFNIQLSKA
jgi:sensory rhodopsin